MRKLLLTISAIAGFAVLGTAQEFEFKKGDVILEGSLGAFSADHKNANTKTTEFSFYPKAGFFVTNKFAVGIDLNVASSTRKANLDSPVEETNKSNTFGVGAFGRYYFLEVGSRFKTYTEFGAKYLTSRSRIESQSFENVDARFNGFNVNAGIGANFFLTEKIAINFMFADVLQYQTQKEKSPDSERDSSFLANINNFGNFFSTSRFGLTFKL
ncbi:outer membrane beta-barrel protein [Sphingobacterium corticibacter]|uniref:Outer membrane protein beta-barrel domain-containing protein n=1 Tax=Sphingobacterium corticibacter TaxID=2171749 RepID=A0A2T8HLY3_9SPHI|nr:outer membrane beta-barrel protein [Sphingobacterium corticibacter]PVH26447.1 hypothetical protein DC487_02175 [Sphingobacterium corticibacter]